MKGGVGMSLHEKEREQVDAYTKMQVIHNPSLHPLFLLFKKRAHSNTFAWSVLEKNKDVGMSENSETIQ